jgi:hypothetical protein
MDSGEHPAENKEPATTKRSKKCPVIIVSILVLMFLGMAILTAYSMTTTCSKKPHETQQNDTGMKRRWTPIFTIEDPFNLTANTLLTTLPSLPLEWMVEFQLKPTNFDHPDWVSIFHMTIGGDFDNIGDRTPAVFFHPNDGLRINSDVSNQHSNFLRDFPAPPIGEWTKIQISQELVNHEFKYRISINENKKFAVGVCVCVWGVDNSKADGFKKVKVFAADPWYPAQPGFVKNLSINVKGE